MYISMCVISYGIHVAGQFITIMRVLEIIHSLHWGWGLLEIIPDLHWGMYT